MQWWGALLSKHRPFGVTRAGGLLVTLGAMNTLQVFVFLMTWLAPLPVSDEYRRLALTMTPIQVVYGIARVGIGVAVLRRVPWSGRVGVATAGLEILGAVVFAARAWGMDIGGGPELPFSDVALNAVLVFVVAVILLIDGAVIRDLVRNRTWFVTAAQPR